MKPARHVPILACACLAALGVGGCAGPGARPSPPADLAARHEGPGVDIEWWVVDDVNEKGRPGLREVLAPYTARAAPVAWETLELWRANGLRVLALTPDELEHVRAGVRMVGVLQTQWVPQGPAWTDVAMSPANGPLAIEMDDGPLVLRQGRLTLALRSWLAPDPVRSDPEASPTLERIPAALVLEAVPRHVSERSPAGLNLPGEAAAAAPRSMVFDRLRLSAVLRGDEVLLILPADVDEQWHAPDAAPIVPQMGPQAPPAATLGDVLLARVSGGRPGRTILVIEPAVSHGYRLMSDAR